jgi:hypothetical protein
MTFPTLPVRDLKTREQQASLWALESSIPGQDATFKTQCRLFVDLAIEVEYDYHTKD